MHYPLLRLLRRLRALVVRKRLDDDLADELQFHLDMDEEKNRAAGMIAADAHYLAHRQFGNAAALKEISRELFSLGAIETWWQDFRYGIRSLARNRGFAAVAILTLALGIGANTAIFTVVHAVLLRPLPYQNPDRIMMIWEKRPREGAFTGPVSPADFLDWRAQNHVFESMAVQDDSTLFLSGPDGLERVEAGVVSPGFFNVFGVQFAHGRGFLPDEEHTGHDRVAVLSDGLWRRRFGSDPNIVGKTITLNQFAYRVVGILPSSFEFPHRELELWTPITFDTPQMRERTNHDFQVYARLKRGFSRTEAQAEMDSISARLEKQYPEANRGHAANVVGMHDQLVHSIQPGLQVLMAAVGFVLLIACANVASLLLARSVSRRREFAVRCALGAGRLRIIRQLLTESISLALLSGAAGVGLALWGVSALKTAIPAGLYEFGFETLTIDSRGLAFALLISLLTGILFGLAPALRASRADLSEAMKRMRLHQGFVTAQIALALVLLIGAGLLMQTFLRLIDVKPGFNPNNLLTVQILLPDATYKTEQQFTLAYEQILGLMRSLHGVKSVAAANVLPLSGEDWRRGITVEGRPPDPSIPTRAHPRIVTPGYFEVMGIPLRRGRYLEAGDNPSGPRVVVVNDTMARRYWPNQNPIGKRIQLAGTNQWRVVAGVVGDVRHWGLDSDPRPEIYLPFEQMPMRSMTLVLRTYVNPLSIANSVRARIRAVDRDQLIGPMSTMEELLERSVSSRRFYMLLVGIFAAVALVLSAAGIYGVISYAVTQRVHEIGVRMALGARRRDVLRDVISQGALLTAIGLAIGCGGALALTGFLSKLLYGVQATDPATFASVSLLLAAVSLGSCYLPARRASRVDPMKALRYE